jgi:uncharacterized ion transporter superfamily protein YfcC
MKNRTFPNALTIVVAFILVAGALTYVIPKGKYDRVVDPGTKREVVVPGSYKLVKVDNLSPFEIMTCIPRGIINGGEVVVLIFLVGGCFFVVDKTGALKEGVGHLSAKLKGREEFALVIVGLLFAFGGAAEGLQEEIIPLIPVLLVLTRDLGYPPTVAVAISFGAATVGAAFSPMNPFGVVIAQRIAEVPFLTGIYFRIFIFSMAFTVWMFMIIRYANRNRLEKNIHESGAKTKLSNSNSLILFIVIMAFALLIFGMLVLGWGFNQISAEFFVVTILVGLIGGMGINNTFIAYAEGFKDMTFAAMIVGLAYGISLVLKEGVVIDSIIYGLFTPLQYVPSAISALGMMGSQAALHVLVPSYSGQAVLTMPILAPLSDLIGLSRDVCVLTYQYGAILMDLIIPTNGALMAVIAIAGLSYKEWFAFILKRLLIIYLLCVIALFAAISMGV